MTIFVCFSSTGGYLPVTTDLRETDKDMVIHAELPGVKKEDVNIDLNNGILTISGEKRDEWRDKGDWGSRRERRYGRFQQSLRVPPNVTEKDVKAQFKDGVLEVSYPKPSQVEKKRIAISSSS